MCKIIQEVELRDETASVDVDLSQIQKFVPFEYGKAIVGGFLGDEGKGKEVDITARKYKKMGLKILSIRGQGSGNAGHTVVVDGKKYDFHYLTSAGLVADLMLLGPGMLIDPIKALEEAEKLPEDKRNIIHVAERATIVTIMDRLMDAWCERERAHAGQGKIGTTGSGVGPSSGNRGYRFNCTFADAKRCESAMELRELLLKNPIFPIEIKDQLTYSYCADLLEAIRKLNIVSSEKVIQKCRQEGDWAVLLEVSQAVCLDPLFGNSGHFTTSTPCTDVGGMWGAGLTMHDFPDGSMMIVKAYGSKVGGGPYITKFAPEENQIAEFIDGMVGERGVTTGRKRDLGWFDAPAIRHSIALTGADICINCMDVIAELGKVTDHVKICFAYRNKITKEVTYDWPYMLSDYEPLYVTLPIKGLTKKEIIVKYIYAIEALIGQKIVGYGVGPSSEGYRERAQAFVD